MCFRIGHFDLSEVVALTRRRAASWLAAGAGHGGGFFAFWPIFVALLYPDVSSSFKLVEGMVAVFAPPQK